MSTCIPKAEFAAHALEMFERVATTGEELLITDGGDPVVKLVSCQPDPLAMLRSLRGTVVTYDEPTEPVATTEWESLR